MKKIYIFIFISSLISCSDDDNDGSGSNITADILGTWEMTSYNYTGTSSTNAQGQIINSDFTGNAFDSNYEITFSENPNVVNTTGDFSIELESTTLGITTSQVVEDAVNLTPNANGAPGEWSVDEDRLTLTNSERSDVFIIRELTDTTMILLLDSEESVTTNGLNIEIDLTGEITMIRE